MIKITVRYYSFQDGDKTPYQADADLPDGRDYHARGETPFEALRVLATFWEGQEKLKNKGEKTWVK